MAPGSFGREKQGHPVLGLGTPILFSSSSHLASSLSPLLLFLLAYTYLTLFLLAPIFNYLLCLLAYTPCVYIYIHILCLCLSPKHTHTYMILYISSLPNL